MTHLETIEKLRDSFYRRYERIIRETLEDQYTMYVEVWRLTSGRRAAAQAITDSTAMEEAYRQLYRRVSVFFAVREYGKLRKLKAAPSREEWWARLLIYFGRLILSRIDAVNQYSADLLASLTAEVTLEVLDNVVYEKLQNDWSSIAITRADRITRTELVTASELGRADAADYITDTEGIETHKRWQANLDAAVREHHAEADGKILPVNEYFSVAGENLRFPTDTSGGATAKNIINCRCTNEYGILKDGTFVTS